MKKDWKSLFKHSFLPCIFMALFSCGSSSPSSSESITPYPFSKINCYLRYMEQTRELQAEMTFRTDSTMAIDGGVFINDEAMIFKKLPKVGLQYRFIKRGQQLDSIYSFSYTERDGTQPSLNIKMNPFKNFRVGSDGISKEKGGILQWDGAPLGTDDGLIFIFTDAKGNSFSINHTGISKGNTFQIIPEHSNRFETGPATLQATRKRTVLVNENGVTKMMTIELYLKTLEFEVKA